MNQVRSRWLTNTRRHRTECRPQTDLAPRIRASHISLVFFCTSGYSVYVRGILVLETVYKIQGEKKRELFAHYGKK